ncbi:phosphate starvation-inducible protein PhoH [Bartonella sp. JB63]|nr:phosphate starvation-inducible protein PhoH [Bartonella sp. JB15]AQX28743.1 phosphate starvation-inducible protein PhoH [Bartonella sp. JB63]
MANLPNEQQEKLQIINSSAKHRLAQFNTHKKTIYARILTQDTYMYERYGKC